MRCSTLAVVLLALLGSVPAFAQQEGERPVGVAVENWIALTETFGFVIVKTGEPVVPTIPGPNPRVLLNDVVPAPPAIGYFMAKTEQGWRRLMAATPEDIAAATKD